MTDYSLPDGHQLSYSYVAKWNEKLKYIKPKTAGEIIDREDLKTIMELIKSESNDK